MALYVYPKLQSVYDVGIRLGGSGLANCIILYARAIALAEEYQLPLINPTWTQFNLGPYRRREKDKRHYAGFFKHTGITGLKKYYLLKTLPRFAEAEVEKAMQSQQKNGVICVEGRRSYFKNILDKHELIKEHLLENIQSKHLSNLPPENFPAIGLHVRLGDFVAQRRTSASWYLSHLEKIRKHIGKNVEAHIFSDGSDEELGALLKIKNVKRVYYGSAIADIIAMSRYQMILGANSTFSALAAYLGQVPVIFRDKTFGPVMEDATKDLILPESDPIPGSFLSHLSNKFPLPGYPPGDV